MLSSAPIFLTSHYFRQNIWPRIFVHFQDIFVDEMTDAHYRCHNSLLLLKAAALDMSPCDLLEVL